MLPAVLSPVLSFWLINYLKEGNCRSYFENGKDKAVKRHLTSNDFFLNTCCILHSEVMPAEGTVRIKLYCLFVPTVATDVLYPLPVAGENTELNLEQSQWIPFTTAGKLVFSFEAWEFCHEQMCSSLLHDPSLACTRCHMLGWHHSFLQGRRDPLVEHRCQACLSRGAQPPRYWKRQHFCRVWLYCDGRPTKVLHDVFEVNHTCIIRGNIFH